MTLLQSLGSAGNSPSSSPSSVFSFLWVPPWEGLLAVYLREPDCLCCWLHLDRHLTPSGYVGSVCISVTVLSLESFFVHYSWVRFFVSLVPQHSKDMLMYKICLISCPEKRYWLRSRVQVLACIQEAPLRPSVVINAHSPTMCEAEAGRAHIKVSFSHTTRLRQPRLGETLFSSKTPEHIK